jgi:diacylglycerol kinase (ATP)
MNRGSLYFSFALLMCLMALWVHSTLWEILLVWIALGSIWFGLGYLTGRGELLFKSPKGRLPFVIRLLLFPILVGTTVYNYFARKADPSPPFQEIRNGIWLGRRLLPSDLPSFQDLGIRAVLDVTAEFDALSEIHLIDGMHYLNIPVMDHDSMQLGQLKRAVSWLHEQQAAGRSVLIHCALGQGRSVMVLLAFLKTLSPDISFEDLLKEVRDIRNTAKPNSRQMRSLVRFVEEGLQTKKPKVCLIHNPVAGLRKRDRDLPKIRKLLEPYVDLDVKKTTKNRSAGALAKEALKKGYLSVVASGGDGTVSEVANVLAGSDACMGIIPRGTANALAVCLYGKAVRVDPIGVGCRHLISGLKGTMDVAEVQGKKMFLLSGVGVEAGMVERADRDLKSKLGPMAYIASALVQLETQTPFKVELEVDGVRHEFESGSVVVANAAPLSSVFAQGGTMPDFRDGYLDVTVLAEAGVSFISFDVLYSLWETLGSESSSSEGIQHFRGKSITIRIHPSQKWVLDGELMESVDVLHFRVIPNGLNVYLGDETLLYGDTK